MDPNQRQRLQDNDLDELICDLDELICPDEAEAEDALAILRDHPNHSSLKSLRIWGMYINDYYQECSLSMILLQINKSIIELDLQDSDICSDGIIAIFNALSIITNTTLKKLELEMDSDAIKAMCRMLKINKSLTELGISFPGIGSDSATMIGDTLKQTTTLLSLRLECVEFGDVGAIAIANGIKENDSSSLKVLKLSVCNIGAVGARAIATMLATNKSLIELDLTGNEMLWKEGVITIVNALKKNKSLRTLTLCYIPLGNEGAIYIASFLSTNISLKSINLQFCDIGDAGAIAIADMLKTNKSLEHLDLAENPISSSVVTNHFAPMLKTNATLKDFRFGLAMYQLDERAAMSILRVLADYNETTNVRICGATYLYHDPDFEIDAEAVELIGIGDIVEENCKGIRIAPLNIERVRRRDIFNGLQSSMWTPSIQEAAVAKPMSNQEQMSNEVKMSICLVIALILYSYCYF